MNSNTGIYPSPHPPPPLEHRTQIECIQDIQNTSRTSPERLMYIQITPCLFNYFYKEKAGLLNSFFSNSVPLLLSIGSFQLA